MGASHPPVGLKVIKSVLSHTALSRNSLSLLLGRTRSPALMGPIPLTIQSQC